MRARFPVLPIYTTDGPIRHWAAALLFTAAVSWVTIIAVAKLIADHV